MHMTKSHVTEMPIMEIWKYENLLHCVLCKRNKYELIDYINGNHTSIFCAENVFLYIIQTVRLIQN